MVSSNNRQMYFLRCLFVELNLQALGSGVCTLLWREKNVTKTKLLHILKCFIVSCACEKCVNRSQTSETLRCVVAKLLLHQHLSGLPQLQTREAADVSFISFISFPLCLDCSTKDHTGKSKYLHYFDLKLLLCLFFFTLGSREMFYYNQKCSTISRFCLFKKY